MKRDLMLMEAILGKLLEAPEPQLTSSGLSRLLNTDAHIIQHHLRLLEDKGRVAEVEGVAWRLTNTGHDYLEGSPEQGIALTSLG